MTSDQSARIAFIGAIIVLVAVCWDGLSGPLVFDDFPNLAPLAEGQAPFPYRRFIFENSSGVFGRSVSMSTFALNHWLRGEFNTFDLKITNLAIHIANGVLLFVIIGLLLNRPARNTGHAWLAMIIATCWLLNPINVGVTFYIIQRMALLACFFVFAGIIFYVLWRRGGDKPAKKRIALLVACLTCWILASLSKENGILLPVLLLITETYFFASGARYRALRIAMISIVVAGFMAVYWLHADGRLNYNNRNFDLVERLSTQPVVIGHYVKELLLPASTDLGLFNDDFPIQRRVWSTSTVCYGVLIALLIGAAIACRPTSQYRPAWAGVLFYFTGHITESTAIPLEIYFEHRNYLPSAGLIFAVAYVASRVVRDRRWGQRIAIVLVSMFFAWYSFFSFSRAQAWASWPSVVTNLYQHHPTSVRAGLEMASLLADAGQATAALKVNEQNAKHNERRKLNLASQRFYFYCTSGAVPDEKEYRIFSGYIYPTGLRETSTAFGLLFDFWSYNGCDNVDFDRIMRATATMIDISVDRKLITAAQAWNVDYYLIEYARSKGRDDFVNTRVQRSIDAGNTRAEYFAQDILKNAPPEAD